MKRTLYAYLFLLLTASFSGAANAQQFQFSQPHGFYDKPFSLEITWDEAQTHQDATIRYTLDGSEPTKASAAYSQPLSVSGNTILRVAAIADTGRVTPVATATYLFANDVLNQPNNPEGYPQQWGKYTQSSGTAVADYEMDPEMTANATLRKKILAGLKELPVLSIVSDKDNFFSHENDPDRGGIYIFTGPPVGDNTGHGWTRPASIELFGGPQNHDLSVNCGIRLHGGHGRLAEKNPKHSFRLVFKEQYGPKTLKYPLYGEDEPKKFDQLVVRCHFGNSWQHWALGNNSKAQYTRDVWARRMQRKMGWTSVNALYVHVFLNGMYWGIYNIAERVDDQFGKDHLGGSKADIDVIKIEEDGGNHLEAAEGDMEAWEQMVETAANAYDDASYYKLQGLDAQGNDDPEQEALLDIDAFIDYMLINQYGGNTDWDHHNWYALRRRGQDSQGFRFLCWDTEIIFENVNENNFGKNNGSSYPTGIFHNLLNNQKFARRYLRRAKELLAPDGLLGEKSVRQVWDSLYTTIATALYDEAARWGDYRRDVHRYNWSDDYQLCTVDGTYMTERNRLINNYFPMRTDKVLSIIQNNVIVDDFEAPDEWIPLTASMFKEWNKNSADAQPTGTAVNVDWNLGVNVNGGGAVVGFVGVEYNHYADISEYDKLVLRGSGSRLRILANRLTNHGPYKQIVVSFNETDPYWDPAFQAIVLPLNDLKTINTNNNQVRKDDFTHLQAMKVEGNNTVNLKGAYLVPSESISTGVELPSFAQALPAGKYYSLSGQLVEKPVRGIYIKDGRKVVVR